MRKVKILIINLLFMLLVSPLVVQAAGSINVSTRNININVGKSSSFTVSANNAAGRVDISTSNSGVASISSSSLFLDNNSSGVTVTGNSAGTATITVRVVDAATYDEEPLNNTYTITVNVVAPATPTPQPVTPPKPVEPSKSSNTNLNSIGVEGFELQSNDKVNFFVTVDSNVDKIKLNAAVQDSKSTLSGIGERNINYGENRFEIIVTAEDGSKKTYTVVVSRKKDNYYLEDLSLALNLENPVVIQLKDDDIITTEILNHVKSSNKEVIFIKKDNDKEVYSYKISSANISDNESINTKVFVSKDAKDYKKYFSLNNGVFLQISSDTILPKGTKFRYYLGDMFDNDEGLQIYSYDGNNKYSILYIDNILLNDGYIEFDADKGNNYFIKKKAIIIDSRKEIQEPVEKKDSNIFMIIAIIEAIIIIGLIAYIVFFIIKNKKNKELSKDIVKTDISINSEQKVEEIKDVINNEKKDESIKYQNDTRVINLSDESNNNQDNK